MDRSGATLETIVNQPTSAMSMIGVTDPQQISPAVATTDSASTGEDWVGVGGFWQQTQWPGEGQAGPCGPTWQIDVNAAPAVFALVREQECWHFALAAHWQQVTRSSDFDPGRHPVMPQKACDCCRLLNAMSAMPLTAMMRFVMLDRWNTASPNRVGSLLLGFFGTL